MIDLIGKRYYFFGLSALLLIAGFIGYLVNGVKLDIQFQGGTIIQIHMNDSNFDTEKAVKLVEEAIGKKAIAQKSQTLNAREDGKNLNLLDLSIASSQALTSAEHNKVVEVIKKEFNIANPQMNVQNVQPFIGKELRNNGIKAMLLASLLIILYIWWRFKIMSGLSAGIMAVLALFHDIAIIFIVYILFKIPLNESFIAAVLTIMGYSMNDTIIIYDRIRENSGLLRKTDVSALVNKSIWQTLARSINTAVTVLISILTVYIFASYYNIQSMKEFSFPLLIGIATGCYSSIFIASPLWAMWKQRESSKRVTSKPSKA